jgi:hypothetical protein
MEIEKLLTGFINNMPLKIVMFDERVSIYIYINKILDIFLNN